MIVEWTIPAQTCLQAIVDYISEDDFEAAHRLVDEIVISTENTLADHPNAGRPGRVENTREWIAHKNYIVAYRVLEGRIQVLSVIHSARLWPSSL